MRATPTSIPTLAALLVALLAGCGTVNDRPACSRSEDCAPGSYCARTPDGEVCWPDASPPRVAAVAATCAGAAPGAACRRDGTLHVTAEVTDDAEVLSVAVTLPELGGPAVELQRGAGSQWSADVPLARVPFEALTLGVTPRVTAVDGARNAASLDAAQVTTVTRVRFSISLSSGLALTSPAVRSDGLVVVGDANHRVHFVSWDGTPSTSTVVGSQQISAAPLLVGDSAWIGSDDNWVYEVTTTGVVQHQNVGGPVNGALAATSNGTIIATGGSSGIIWAKTPSGWRNGSPGANFTTAPVVAPDDSFYAGAGSSVRRFVFATGIPVDSWSTSGVDFMGALSDPLVCTTALLAAGTLGSVGQVTRIGASGEPEHIVTTGRPSGGVAVLADDSILLPELAGSVSRWTSSGARFPGWQSAVLNGAPRTPLVLAGPETYLVPTSTGRLYALGPDGSVRWSGRLTPGSTNLQPGNLYTPPGQAGPVMSTAYFAGADGVLYGIVVDGALDGAAPWPKAFHDPQNTNRAGPQP